MHRGSRDRDESLKEKLEQLYRTYNGTYLGSDPLRFPHRYGKGRDREIVAFIASSLAYGRVDRIAGILEQVLAVIGHSPYNFVLRFIPSRHAHLFDHLKYRFHTGRDIAALVYAIHQMIEGWGSIEEFFVSQEPRGGVGMKARIEGFSRNALCLDYKPFFSPDELSASAFKLFFPLPSRGSACKRLNLYLRWMVRREDGLDLGLWRSIDPSELLVPVDTHVSRIAYAVGLAEQPRPSWRTVEEVTASLAKFDPTDPVKYDFSLSRLGILNECRRRRVASKCGFCLLRELCRFPASVEVDV